MLNVQCPEQCRLIRRGDHQNAKDSISPRPPHENLQFASSNLQFATLNYPRRSDQFNAASFFLSGKPNEAASFTS
jgi:hypothetical protein